MGDARTRLSVEAHGMAGPIHWPSSRAVELASPVNIRSPEWPPRPRTHGDFLLSPRSTWRDAFGDARVGDAQGGGAQGSGTQGGGVWTAPGARPGMPSITAPGAAAKGFAPTSAPASARGPTLDRRR